MNPLLQSIQESLKTIQSSSFKPTYSTTTPELPPQYKAAGKAVVDVAKPVVKPIFGAIKLGLDMIDYAAGAPGSFAEHIKTGQPVKARKLTEQIGDVSANYFGEGSRFPAELATGFLLPPFGFGGVTKSTLKTISKADALKFAERAAVETDATKIALDAEKTFPGISKEAAQNIGTQYVKETDAAKIFNDLKPPTPREVEYSTYTRSKEIVPGTAARVTDTTRLQRPTIPNMQAAREFVRLNPTVADRIAETTISGDFDTAMFVNNAVRESLEKQADELAAIGKTMESEAMKDRAADLLEVFYKNATEGGKIGQASSILGRTTPEGMVRFFARAIEKENIGRDGGKLIPTLSKDAQRALVEEWKNIQKIADPNKKAEAISKYFDKVGDFIPTSNWKKASTLWKAGLLTGLRTTGLNLVSTGTNVMAEIVKDVPASVVDQIWSAVSGKRTIGLTLRGLGSGAVEGAKKGWYYLRTGYSERDIRNLKFDMNKVSMGTSAFAKGVQRYEEYIFRWIGFQDMPFYYGAKARSMFDQAIAQGKNLGLKGEELKKYVDELVQSPTDEMVKYATLDAEIATFQNSTKLGELGQAVQRTRPGEFIIPFARTPAAVVMQAINYTPLGIVAELGRASKRGFVDQRLMSQAIGRSVTGSAAIWLGKEMFDNGAITLSYPKTESEREQWAIEGRIPNSIKVGDRWVSLGVFGPLGVSLSIGGNLANGLQKTGSITEATLQAGASLGSVVTEQSFLKGMNDFMDLINDPSGEATGYFGGYIGSFVPTIVADIARAGDKYERRSTETLFGRLQSRIPVLRESLEPKVNTLGERVKTPGIVSVMLDPSRSSKMSSDPTVLELRRLIDAGYGSTPTKLGLKDGYSMLTPKQNTALWRMAGMEIYNGLESAFKNPEYKNLPDEQKQKLIKQFTEDAKTKARASLLFAMTQGLSGKGVQDEIIRIRDASKSTSDKFLTQEVFKMWVDYRQQAGMDY